MKYNVSIPMMVEVPGAKEMWGTATFAVEAEGPKEAAKVVADRLAESLNFVTKTEKPEELQ